MTDEIRKKTVLGTVQFGLEYGVNNLHGKPSRESALEMLRYARERGIRTLDTAFAYGDAEDVIGEFIEKNGDKAREISVISKLKPHAFFHQADISKTNAVAQVEKEVKKSLARIRRGVLDGYLFHTPGYIYNEALIAAMEYVKSRGLVRNIGVSIYETEDALYAADHPAVDFIQIPFNILDQRFARNDFFERARANNTTVFARSPFLQGLLFMDPDAIPVSVAPAREHLRVFQEIIGRYGFSIAEAALLFSYTTSGIDHVVFGVDTKEQLVYDLDVIEQAQSPRDGWEECRYELENNFFHMEDHIIFPSLWKDPNNTNS